MATFERKPPWVVVDRDGNLEVLSTSTLNELYQPI